jgi:folate-binding protein YgfZ
MRSNYTTTLKNKRVISVTGDDSETFLNNIITNDIKKINTEKAIYSCLLSPQGKVISHFFVIKVKNQFLFIIDSFLLNELIEKLNFYKLRSKIDITEDNRYDIFFTLDDNLKLNSIFEFNDPRNKKLGKYMILNKNTEGINLESDKFYSQIIDANGMIDNIFNQIKGQYFSLELNLKELKAIDFSKGCYVGQENTSRMNLKNKISKRIFRINSTKGIELNDDLLFENEIIGKVISLNPDFAIIKMSKFENFINKHIKSKSNDQINIYKPNWIELL